MKATGVLSPKKPEHSLIITEIRSIILLKENRMNKGVYTMFYTSEAEELRAFLRDKLGFPYTDVGDE